MPRGILSSNLHIGVQICYLTTKEDLNRIMTEASKLKENCENLTQTIVAWKSTQCVTDPA